MHSNLPHSCQQCSLGIFCLNQGNTHLISKKRVLKNKEILHRPHDKFTHLYLIQKGVLKTCNTDSFGNENIHNFYFQNEVFGYEAIALQKYPFLTIAISDTLMCEIPYKNFLSLIESEPKLISHFLYSVSHQLTFGEYLKSITAQQKLVAFLLDIAGRLSCNHENGFLLPLTYQDIGNYLNLASETVSRLFSYLRKTQLISIDKKYITLADIPKLKKLIA